MVSRAFVHVLVDKVGSLTGFSRGSMVAFVQLFVRAEARLDTHVSRARGDIGTSPTQSLGRDILTWRQDYLTGVAQKYDLYRHIRFNTAVEELHWDDAFKKWDVKVKVLGGKEAEAHETYTISTDFVVSAVGQLNNPSYPDIPGLADFKGKKMHSARWDWSYDLKGKRIALIGNGTTLSTKRCITSIIPCSRRAFSEVQSTKPTRIPSQQIHLTSWLVGNLQNPAC